MILYKDYSKSLPLFFNICFAYLLLSIQTQPLAYFFSFDTLTPQILVFLSIVLLLKGTKTQLLLFLFTLSLLTLHALLITPIDSNSLRFFSLLSIILFVPLSNLNRTNCLNIFRTIMLVFSISIILCSIFSPFYFNNTNNSEFRLFLKESQIGDIYTYNGYFYRIQLKGGALLPIYFFIEYLLHIKRKSYVTLAIAFIATIVSGQLAFAISITIFYFLIKALKQINFHKKTINKVVFKVILLFFVLCILSLPYLNEVIEAKFNGGDATSSLGRRAEQGLLLLSGINDAPIFGNGLGQLLNKTGASGITYNTNYFELQWLFIIYKIGIVGFFIYTTSHFIILLEKVKTISLWTLYFCYLLYASTNPYIFDTNHIIVLILMNYMSSIEEI